MTYNPYFKIPLLQLWMRDEAFCHIVRCLPSTITVVSRSELAIGIHNIIFWRVYVTNTHIHIVCHFCSSIPYNAPAFSHQMVPSLREVVCFHSRDPKRDFVLYFGANCYCSWYFMFRVRWFCIFNNRLLSSIMLCYEVQARSCISKHATTELNRIVLKLIVY